METLLIGKEAPHFIAKAVVDGKIVDDFSLKQFLGQYVIFFFYPLDFTFVCPTELHAFQEKLGDFVERNGVVIGCSVDSAHTHLAWLNTPKSKGGIQGITYPLIADLTKSVASAFHVLKEDEGLAYRGLFLIDKAGIVRHQLVNDLPLGRSIDEALRILDALIYHETHGEVCPANWKTGDRTMKESRQSVEDYFTVR